jgi:ADP-ribose pyrophosphatase YjhB (NUDIX family)
MSVLIPPIEDQEKFLKIAYAGGFIFDIKSQKVLVVRGEHKWSLPKGSLNENESHHEGAMREIYEETSLIIELKSNHISRNILSHIYYLIILENKEELELKAIDTKEVKEVRWCTCEELKTLNCNKPLVKFINKWNITLNVIKKYSDQISLKGKTKD